MTNSTSYDGSYMQKEYKFYKKSYFRPFIRFCEDNMSLSGWVVIALPMLIVHKCQEFQWFNQNLTQLTGPAGNPRPWYSHGSGEEVAGGRAGQELGEGGAGLHFSHVNMLVLLHNWLCQARLIFEPYQYIEC